MNREEFANKWAAVEIYEDGLPISIVIQARYNDLLADLDSLSLPPAEGAETEETKELEAIFNLEQELNIPMKDRFHNSEKGKALFDAIYGKPQPTAEGAEEIFTELEFVKLLVDNTSGKLDDFEFRKIVNKRANDFAALHAQRIADKMVEERSEFIKKAVIRFFYTEVDLNFCTREYRDRVEWYFNTYQHEIFKLPKTSFDNFKSRDSHESV